MTSSGRRNGPTTKPAATNSLPTVTGSFALAHGPLARALHEYARATGSGSIADLRLRPHNVEQREIVSWILEHLAEIPTLRDLKSMASPDYEALNKFLVNHGFNPLFTPFPRTDLGITSVIDATMLWKVAGTPTTLMRQGVEYPAFKLTNKTANVQNLHGGGLFTDRIVIDAQSGHQLYLAMLPENHSAPSNGAGLLGLARQMLGARNTRGDASGGIILPKINFDIVSELPWLDGLSVGARDGTNGTLVQCRQHVKLYMNEAGARMAAAFAGVVARGMAPRPYVVNRHFVLAVVDDTTPTAVFYLNPDSWSEPPAGAIAE